VVPSRLTKEAGEFIIGFFVGVKVRSSPIDRIKKRRQVLILTSKRVEEGPNDGAFFYLSIDGLMLLTVRDEQE
jgi:hypothetical protein